MRRGKIAMRRIITIAVLAATALALGLPSLAWWRQRHPRRGYAIGMRGRMRDD